MHTQTLGQLRVHQGEPRHLIFCTFNQNSVPASVWARHIVNLFPDPLISEMGKSILATMSISPTFYTFKNNTYGKKEAMKREKRSKIVSAGGAIPRRMIFGEHHC